MNELKKFAHCWWNRGKLLRESYLLAQSVVPPRRAAPTEPPGVVTVDELVIDVSASMESEDYEPSRLAGAVKAASEFLKRRAAETPHALVGIVAFSSLARVAISPVTVQRNLPALQQALHDLATDDSTDIGQGLRLAHEEITKIGHARNPRVILLTDGHADTGTHPEAVAKMIKEKGIQLDVIGIGGSPEDVDESVLRRMASVVRGELRYWFIASVGDLVRRFESLALQEIK